MLHSYSANFQSFQPHQSSEPVEEISDSNYGNNCHKVMDNCAYSQRYKGVVPQQNGNWGAQVYTNNQRIWLGTFKSEKDAAIAYDRALIKLRSSDAPRNFCWTEATVLEAEFQSLHNMETILAMIKEGSYQSTFDDFLLKTDKGNGKNLYVQKSCGVSWRLLFQKELTLSDVSKLNRFVIPKKHAVTHFSPVTDKPRGPDNNGEVMLSFYDVHGKLWKFRYCYWKSSQSFVFTRGWNQFVKEKGLMANDKITFYHYSENLEKPDSWVFVIDTCPSACYIGSSLKLGMGTQVKYLVSKEDEGSVDDQEMSDEVIQTSNVETKGFKLFGVQIA
ncbi:AP2/B3 transcription factor family protein [Artemisia annua]|uniref:AP2/B3 transcription factor family protein n=1 Tax=Artemisia annua TaxID=35608 RepID=A0A2U1M1M4_ARTAN|nr:AP2/B3 transcription factor family protein [Artemisia annua]